MLVGFSFKPIDFGKISLSRVILIDFYFGLDIEIEQPLPCLCAFAGGEKFNLNFEVRAWNWIVCFKSRPNQLGYIIGQFFVFIRRFVSQFLIKRFRKRNGQTVSSQTFGPKIPSEIFSSEIYFDSTLTSISTDSKFSSGTSFKL